MEMGRVNYIHFFLMGYNPKKDGTLVSHFVGTGLAFQLTWTNSGRGDELVPVCFSVKICTVFTKN